MILGLFVGESFAELSLVDPRSGTSVEHKRWYLPRQGLKNYLQNWLSKSPVKPDRVIVASRFLYKLSGHRLGGSVAQIVTSGFEKWGPLTSPALSLNLRHPTRTPSISSQDLIFPLSERIHSDGRVVLPVQESELTAIHEKLQLMGVKKICLHFHNSEINKVNQEQVKSFFLPLEYEIFEPAGQKQFPSIDPMILWRTNTLNAAIGSTFDESKKEILDGLSESISQDHIFFFDAELSLHRGESRHRLSSLFALEACLYQQISRKFPKVSQPTLLHWGLEHFSQISGNQGLSNSPWGLLAINSWNCQDFKVQPTSLLELNDNGWIMAKSPQTFEPGPIHVGRGLKPLVADLLIDDQNWDQMLGLDEKQGNLVRDRWRLILQTWQRATRKTSTSLEDLAFLWREQISASLIEEIQNQVEGAVINYGYLSPRLKVPSEKVSPGLKVLAVSETEFPKSLLLAQEALLRGIYDF